MSTATPPRQVPPTAAERQYVELFGSSLVLNAYLRVAVLALSVVALGLLGLTWFVHARAAQLKPLVIRIDDVGRAEAVRYEALTYRPSGQAPELKYFLAQFVTKHLGRMRATVKAQWAESLYFLDTPLADAAMDDDRRQQTIAAFLSGTADESDIRVTNVTLDTLAAPPYNARITYDKVTYAGGIGLERARERFEAQVTFVLRDHVPNAMVPVNPLGLAITYIRIDQAFR